MQWIAAAIIALLIAGALVQALLSYRSARKYPAAGRLVAVNGRQVHLRRAGQGSPAVILEAGLPGNSLTWTSVFSEIAEHAQVCTYDRPGYGWSQATLSPRIATSMVEELRTLLQDAGVKPPYVLAGHSFGGLLMQCYAARFPDDVVGMVLVDSAHPDRVHRTLGLREIDMFALILTTLGPIGLVRMLFPVPAGSSASREVAVRKQERELLMTNRTLRTVSREMACLRASLRQVADRPPDLGDKPLVVLSEGRQRAESWHAVQADLARLSTNSEWQVVEEAGHFIHHDRPDAVVAAVRRVIQKLEAPADRKLP